MEKLYERKNLGVFEEQGIGRVQGRFFGNWSQVWLLLDIG